MPDRPSSDPDGEIFADDAAARLLERASELDAAATGATVTELRSAAAEAGISPSAFDAALAELRRNQQTPRIDAHVPHRGHRRTATLTFAAVIVLAISAIGVSRLVPRSVTQTATPLIEQAFALRCITPEEAIQLVRPLISGGTTTVRYSPAHTPGILVIRATPAQIEMARSKLAPYEGPASQACPR
jgi:hypothetical protein